MLFPVAVTLRVACGRNAALRNWTSLRVRLLGRHRWNSGTGGRSGASCRATPRGTEKAWPVCSEASVRTLSDERVRGQLPLSEE